MSLSRGGWSPSLYRLGFNRSSKNQNVKKQTLNSISQNRTASRQSLASCVAGSPPESTRNFRGLHPNVSDECQTNTLYRHRVTAVSAWEIISHNTIRIARTTHAWSSASPLKIKTTSVGHMGRGTSVFILCYYVLLRKRKYGFLRTRRHTWRRNFSSRGCVYL